MPKSSVPVRMARLVCAVALFITGVVVSPAPAAAQDDDIDDAGFVEIIEVSGLLDDVVADALEDSIRSANADGARALVLQLNSKQAVVSDDRLDELAVLIDESPVPVAVWVGPSGSRAAGKVAQLVGVADDVGVAIGARLGPTGDQVLDPDRFGTVWGANQALLEDTDLTWEQAIDVGIVECELVSEDELGNALTPEEALARCANPTLGDFLVSLDTIESRVVDTDAGPRRALVTRARFSGLSLLDQLMHTVASPPVAYLMLVIGLALVIFEFYSIGVGIAGVIGAVFAALGGYGLAVLPIRTWALVLLVLSMLAFAIDVQTAVPRAWTVIGMVLFVLGTLFLYPRGDVSMSWIPMVVAIVGVGVVMFRGLPIMIRGRFATTAIPRDFLVHQRAVVSQVRVAGLPAETSAGPGVAEVRSDDVAPPHPLVVEVRGAPWPARSEAVLAVGDDAVVADVDGLVLVVEPVA